MSGANKYKVPSMAEVKSTKPNGFEVASTFAGGGGSSLGYRMAGFKVLYANEFVPEARETYKANASESTYLDGRDIRKVSAEDILEKIGKKKGELDVFDGSPPCASFSMAGAREKHWGKVKQYSGTTQQTDNLFEEYLRLVEGINPKVFIAENVQGLIIGKAKGYFNEILRKGKSLGYNTSASVIDASWLGVPQSRKRVIFCGVREDVGKPSFPAPFKFRYSIKNALEDTKNLGRPEPETSMKGYAVYREAIKLKQGERSKKYFQLYRPRINDPASTICAGHGLGGVASIFHPVDLRKFSIAEVKRLCSFPDDFKLCGTYKQQYERLGRAVPPLMMKAIAENIANKILK